VEKAIVKVEGMACEHCVKAIQNAVGTLPGVIRVKASLKDKNVALEFDPMKCSLDRIKTEIEEQGYDIVA